LNTGNAKKNIISIAALIMAVLPLIFFSASCRKSGYKGRMETVTLSAAPLEQIAMVYVAEQKKFFTRNGINLVIKYYDSGAASAGAMSEGKADIAEAAEFPFVRLAMEKSPFRIIAANDNYENCFIASSAKSGINKIIGLKGKKIGLAYMTITEFYLGRILELNGLSMADIIPVDLKPEDFVDAMVSGKTDAVIVWQPYLYLIQKEIKDLNIWSAHAGQLSYGVLACKSAWLDMHSATLQHFLESLFEAEKYIENHPLEAKSIVQAKLKYDKIHIDEIWNSHDFSLSLGQPLIIAMKDEAKWMINNKMTKEKALPDFASYIYTDGLKTVKPDAVNIIR
jgi:ABC-type nitrate/sulfonate/bicarbonate transport system substrate-binding protein